MYNSGTTSQLNNTYKNQGGYVSTNVGKAYVDGLYTNLPDDGPNGLKANIKKVTITCNSGYKDADGNDTNGMSTYTTDAHMFLASSKEVGFVLSGYKYAAEGTCFDLFTNDNSSRTGFMSTANISDIWWLRSASSGSTDGFYGVYTSGHFNFDNAPSADVVVPAFVIG